MRKASLNSKGFALAETLMVLVILLVVGAGGYYIYHHSKTTKKAPSSNATGQTKSNQTGKNNTTADPYAGWKQYCSAQEKSCFKYPSDWVTKDVGAVDPVGDGLQVTSPSGTVLWFQSAVSGLGGACQPSAPDVFNQKVFAQPNVSNLYIVESGTEDGTVNHIGLVNGSNGQAPKTGDTGSCVSATTFTSRHDPAVYSWLESNGTSNLKKSDLTAAELILKSYNY